MLSDWILILMTSIAFMVTVLEFVITNRWMKQKDENLVNQNVSLSFYQTVRINLFFSVYNLCIRLSRRLTRLIIKWQWSSSSLTQNMGKKFARSMHVVENCFVLLLCASHASFHKQWNPALMPTHWYCCHLILARTKGPTVIHFPI